MDLNSAERALCLLVIRASISSLPNKGKQPAMKRIRVETNWQSSLQKVLTKELLLLLLSVLIFMGRAWKSDSAKYTIPMERIRVRWSRECIASKGFCSGADKVGSYLCLIIVIKADGSIKRTLKGSRASTRNAASICFAWRISDNRDDLEVLEEEQSIIAVNMRTAKEESERLASEWLEKDKRSSKLSYKYVQSALF